MTKEMDNFSSFNTQTKKQEWDKSELSKFAVSKASFDM